MVRTFRASHDTAVRRARVVRRVMPLAALSAAALPYALHHGTPLDGHGAGIVLIILAAAAAVAAIPATLARAVERQLPVVIPLRAETIEIRPLRAGDLDFCTALHEQTLPHNFFAQLGYRFLRAYLATFVESPHAKALIAAAEDAPVGTVVGMLRPRAHTRWVLRRHGWRLALLGATALALRPGLAIRFARTRFARYRRAWGRRRVSHATEAVLEPAVLAHVAVTPGAQGAGIGSRLVDAFVDAARAAGSQEVVLTTLEGADGAAGFYRRHGWTETAGYQDFDGNPVLAFSLRLTPGAR